VRRLDRRVWQTLIAPALGLAGLVICLTLTVRDFPTLIGGSSGLAGVIGAILVGSFLAGVVLPTGLRPAVVTVPAAAV